MTMSPFRTCLPYLALVLASACVTPFEEVANVPQGQASEPQEEPGPTPADFDPYFVESEGLPRPKGPEVITRNVLQDSSGGIWLATWHGLMRFDGTTFTNVTKEEGLRPFRCFCLFEDRDANVWIGTVGAGVMRYDGERYTNFTTKDGLVDDVVLSIHQDRTGNLWFGGLGLTKFDGETFTTFSEADGFTDLDVNSISEAEDGTLWFGTRSALFRYDGERFTNFTDEQSLSIVGYIPTVIDRRGDLWFGGQNGIYHFDGESLRHPFPSSSYSMMEDSQGHIWFSGGVLRNAGSEPGTSVLNRFDPAAGIENLVVEREQFVIWNGAIFGLTEDRDGSLWIGTGGGVARIADERVHHY